MDITYILLPPTLLWSVEPSDITVIVGAEMTFLRRTAKWNWMDRKRDVWEELKTISIGEKFETYEVKFTLKQSKKAQRGSRGIALLFL